LIDDRIYAAMVAALVAEGGYLASSREAAALETVMWDDHGHRLAQTVACPPQVLARVRASKFRRTCSSSSKTIESDPNTTTHARKLTTLLAVYRYHGFDQALEMVKQIYEVGGKGHSCGILLDDDAHIDQLARIAPVSRMMVRQAQSEANAGPTACR
jgi:sulfoacetaldehyde dehydrogenase